MMEIHYLYMKTCGAVQIPCSTSDIAWAAASLKWSNCCGHGRLGWQRALMNNSGMKEAYAPALFTCISPLTLLIGEIDHVGIVMNFEIDYVNLRTNDKLVRAY